MQSEPRATGPSLLVSPGFLAALAMLVVNDALLKARYGNWLTGKLSDFAGLFAFALFWTALLPKQRTWIHVASGLAFLLWKSFASDGLIALWNASAPLAIGRVVDPSDGIALGILPLAWWYAEVASPVRALQRFRRAAACGALLAFAATSRQLELMTESDGSIFVVPMSEPLVFRTLGALDREDSTFTVEARGGVLADTATFHFGESSALVELSSAASGETLLTLVSTTSYFQSVASRESLRREFSTKVVDKLRRRAATGWPPS